MAAFICCDVCLQTPSSVPLAPGFLAISVQPLRVCSIWVCSVARCAAGTFDPRHASYLVRKSSHAAMPIGSAACAANVVAAISESAMPRLDLTRLDPNRIIVTTPCLVISDGHEGVPHGRSAAAGRVRYGINQVGSVTDAQTTVGNRRGRVIEWCFFSAAMQNTGRNIATCARNRRVYAASKFDLAQIDAFAKLRFDRLLLAALADLDHIGAGVFLELVELEVAVVIACGLRHHLAILRKLHARAFNAVDYAAHLGRDAAADEGSRIAPEIRSE